MQINLEKNNDYWKTNLNEVMYIFRGALNSLVPWLEKSKIPWKDEAAYDDWEAISECLYFNLVLRSISFSDPLYELEGIKLSRYDRFYSDYSEISYVEVIPNLDQKNYFNEIVESLGKNTIWAFNSFETSKTPFDMVSFIGIDEKGKPINNDFELPIEKIEFQFRYRKSPKELIILKELNVHL
jgi:hypothetical protein